MAPGLLSIRESQPVGFGKNLRNNFFAFSVPDICEGWMETEGVRQ